MDNTDLSKLINQADGMHEWLMNLLQSDLNQEVLKARPVGFLLVNVPSIIERVKMAHEQAPADSTGRDSAKFDTGS